VIEDGSVRCYTDLHGNFSPFSLGNVSDCNFAKTEYILNLHRVQKNGEFEHADFGLPGLLPYLQTINSLPFRDMMSRDRNSWPLRLVAKFIHGH
jgi:hypothetical protein